MKKQNGYSILLIMFALTAVFITVGYFVLKSKSLGEPPQNNQTQTPAEEPKEEAKEPVVDDSMAGWKTYTNTKYNYVLQYPPNLKAGSISGNSSLGTFDAPVRGFDVGPLVLVTLTGDLRKEGADYFMASYAIAQNPLPPIEGGPNVECKIDKIINPNATIKSVTCTGEGGPARYALITGTNYDIFVDGYSKGFDESDNGEFQSNDDYIKILSSFKFLTP